MNITQSDRDALRASQYKINSRLIIGNIIEHKVQDPKLYKKQSIPMQDYDRNVSSQIPIIHYKSKYLNNEPIGILKSISEDNEPDLPTVLKDFHDNLVPACQIEFDKLEWMSSKADKIYQGQLKSTTRFDKDGRALSFCVDNKNSSDAQDEGHDIESLVNLLDSAYQPQVTYALNVITKITTQATMGYYDGAFNDNIHHLLIKNCLLRVRHQIDNRNETICQSALKCMRALICNTQVDEVILDRIYPLISEDSDPCLWLHSNEMNTQEFTIEMKDNECVEKDVILALIHRTDILKRFSYLLKVKLGMFSDTYNECILDILIRMARHSSKSCCLLKENDLLSLVIDLFLPLSITSENKKVRALSVKALKLIRIIAQATKELENKQLSANNILPDTIIPVVEAYFFIDCYSLPPNQTDQLFKLHIETLRIMKVLFMLKQFCGKIISLVAMGRAKLCVVFKAMASLSATKLLNSKISFDWQYAAHLIDLVGLFVRYAKYHTAESFTETIWSNYIKPILFQWLADIISMKSIPHLDVSVAIAAAVYHYKDRSDDQGKKALVDVMITSILKENNGIDDHNLNFFKILARTASEKSQLPNFLKESGKLRDPKGLPSYGCLNYNTSTQYEFKLSPLFDIDSPYILLNMFICQLQQKKLGTLDNIKVFIDNIDLIRYIRSITGYHKFPTTYESLAQQSIMAQYEIQIIGRSILLLSLHYLEYTGIDGGIDGCVYDSEPIDLEQNRLECYSNLCYYTISAIGLLNASAEHIVNLKDQLFEKVLLNFTLQARVSRENFTKKPNSISINYEQRDFICGDTMFNQLTSNNLRVLVPLYISCKQSDRFWIFQPIINFYSNQTRDLDGCKQYKDRWFQHNISWRLHTGELALSNDNTIISIILSFNSTMMHYSPSYNHLVVRPNIEDYLCLIGTIFLYNDLFLDEQVSKALRGNLKIILTECIGKSEDKFYTLFKDASKIIKPLDLPLADFFNKLVDQFEATSYGDIAFSNFLLLFITPGSDKVFRKMLFQEKVETCLSQLRIGLDELWAPRKIFFGQRETDPEIKSFIRRSKAHIFEGSFLMHYRNFHIQP